MGQSDFSLLVRSSRLMRTKPNTQSVIAAPIPIPMGFHHIACGIQVAGMIQATAKTAAPSTLSIAGKRGGLEIGLLSMRIVYPTSRQTIHV